MISGAIGPDLNVLASRLEWTAFIILVAIVVWRIAVALIARVFARRFISAHIPRVATFSTLTRSLVVAIVLVAAALALLSVWDVNVTPAVWSAGFVTAALAFGSQNLVRDIVTGFFFLFEDQYDVGDRVELVTITNQVVTGTVVAMELRTTKLVDASGRIVIVPNGNVALVTNASRMPTMANFTLQLPWKGDVVNMRQQVETYARDIAHQAGKSDARVSVVLAESSPDDVRFRVELRSANADADLEQSHLRERLTHRLQADGWLPAGAPPDGAS